MINEKIKKITAFIFVIIGIVFLCFMFYKIGYESNVLTSDDIPERDLTEFSLNISDELTKSLNYYYNNSDGKEFGVCLIGSIENDTINLYDFSKFRKGKNSSIKLDYCNDEGEIGFLHSHPNHHKQSFSDAHFSFESIRWFGNKINVVMTDINTFIIYTENYWNTGVILKQ